MKVTQVARIVCLFLNAILVTSVDCQPTDLQFEHITTLNGLSQDIITCLYRDRFGFLWIGTEDGLNRYDGYSIATYKHNPRDTNTLPNNRIHGVCDYGTEDLLVTTEGGISIYHRAANIFTAPDGNLKAYATLASAKPLRDKVGRYWMIIESRRLLRYDPTTDSILLFDPNGTSTLPQVIKDLTIDMEDSLWVTSLRSVSVFQEHDSRFRNYQTNYEHYRHGEQILNTSITKDSDGNLWIGTNAGLFRYDRITEAAVFVPVRFMLDTSVVDRDMIVGGL